MDETGVRREVYARASKVGGPARTRYDRSARLVRGDDAPKGTAVDLLA